MLQFGVIGHKGRMGQALEAAIADAGHALFAGVDAGGSIGPFAAQCDVLVDFSAPDALAGNLGAAKVAGKPIIVGTTGLEEPHFVMLAEAARGDRLLREQRVVDAAEPHADDEDDGQAELFGKVGRVAVRAERYTEAADADALLTELAAKGFIVRYMVDGTNYIAIPTFTRHQNPHVKEPPSLIPALDKSGASPVQEPDKPGSGPADSLLPLTDSLSPDSLIGGPPSSQDQPPRSEPLSSTASRKRARASRVDNCT